MLETGPYQSDETDNATETTTSPNPVYTPYKYTIDELKALRKTVNPFHNPIPVAERENLREILVNSFRAKL